MEEIIVTLISSCTLVIVAMIQVTNVKNKKIDESRYQRRLKHEEVTGELIQCDVKMSVLSARKQSGDKIDGELTKAINSTETAFQAYEKFNNHAVASSIAKI